MNILSFSKHISLLMCKIFLLYCTYDSTKIVFSGSAKSPVITISAECVQVEKSCLDSEMIP